MRLVCGVAAPLVDAHLEQSPARGDRGGDAPAFLPGRIQDPFNDTSEERLASYWLQMYGCGLNVASLPSARCRPILSRATALICWTTRT